MTDITTTTRTPAEELRDAAKTLRCDHSFPIQPPHGSLARPGACSKCGIYILSALDVPDALAELLAKLLDAIDDPYTAMPDGVILDLATAIRLRGVDLARAINGTATQ